MRRCWSPLERAHASIRNSCSDERACCLSQSVNWIQLSCQQSLETWLKDCSVTVDGWVKLFCKHNPFVCMWALSCVFAQHWLHNVWFDVVGNTKALVQIQFDYLVTVLRPFQVSLKTYTWWVWHKDHIYVEYINNSTTDSHVSDHSLITSLPTDPHVYPVRYSLLELFELLKIKSSQLGEPDSPHMLWPQVVHHDLWIQAQGIQALRKNEILNSCYRKGIDPTAGLSLNSFSRNMSSHDWFPDPSLLCMHTKTQKTHFFCWVDGNPSKCQLLQHGGI